MSCREGAAPARRAAILLVAALQPDPVFSVCAAELPLFHRLPLLHDLLRSVRALSLPRRLLLFRDLRDLRDLLRPLRVVLLGAL